MKPAVEWVSRPEPARGSTCPRSGRRAASPRRDHLERRGEHELARVEHERLAVVHLDQRGEVVLLLGGVDMGVQVVVEDPEPPVEADVDAGRLDQLGVERLELSWPLLISATRSRSESSIASSRSSARAEAGRSRAERPACRASDLVHMFDRVPAWLPGPSSPRPPRASPTTIQRAAPPVRAGLRLPGDRARRRRPTGASGLAGDHRRWPVLLRHATRPSDATSNATAGTRCTPIPPEHSDDEAYLAGRARPVTDPRRRERLARNHRAAPQVDWRLFELRHRGGDGDTPHRARSAPRASGVAGARTACAAASAARQSEGPAVRTGPSRDVRNGVLRGRGRRLAPLVQRCIGSGTVVPLAGVVQWQNISFPS